MSKFSVGNTKSSKLTGVEVMEIREKYATGLYTMSRLAREYHVTRNTISDIVHCITWQNLPGIAPAHVMQEEALRSMRKLDELLSAGGLPPASAELSDDMLAATERAALAPKPEFKPSANITARAAAYGAQSKPAIQAQTVQGDTARAAPVASQATNEEEKHE